MEFLFNILSGGGFGLLGSIASKIGGYFETKQKIELRRLEFSHEVSLLEMQTQARKAELESEQAIAEIAASRAAKSASYRHDASYGPVYMWAATVLRMVRPAITLFLCVLTWRVWAAAAGEQPSLEREIVNQILFLTSMAISWWFGDRQSGRSGEAGK